MKEKLKIIWKYFLRIVAACFILFFSVVIIQYFRVKQDNIRDDKNRNYRAAVQYIQSVVEVFHHIEEKSTIEIDPDFKNELKEASKKILADLDYKHLEEIPFWTCVYAMYVDDYFELDYAGKLNNILYQYYLPNYHLFTMDDKILKNKEAKLTQEQWTDCIGKTCMVLELFADTGIVFDQKGAEEQMLSWYHTFEKEKSMEDIVANDYYEFPSLIWYFTSRGQQEQLDTKFNKRLLEIQYKKALQGKEDMSTMYAMDDAIPLYADIYGWNSSLKNFTQDIFQSLKTEKAFGYSKENNLYVIDLSMALRLAPKHLEKNAYFAENINHWLIENYQTCWKEEISKSVK